jgi:hypothetical protein
MILVEGDSNKHDDTPTFKDEQLSDMIDSVLGQMDHNNNGYVEYEEYRTSGVAENRKSDFPDSQP